MFPEGKVPTAPFIVFYQINSENFGADGGVYHKDNNWAIEMYCDSKTPELEEKIETILDDLKTFWEKEEVWIESEKYIEVIYSV